MPSTLVFDLDGTLVDSAPDLLAATNAVLAARGRASIEPASLRHMVGIGARSLIIQAFAATGPEASAAELPGLVELFLEHYRAHIADQTVVFPGVTHTLGELARQGARLGVLTNKAQPLVDQLLPALGLARYFGVVYGAGRKPYGKPDARIFRDLVGELSGREGGDAVMIGDSITDVETARAAGVPVILVSHGYTPRPARELGGDLVIDRFEELPAALARLARR